MVTGEGLRQLLTQAHFLSSVAVVVVTVGLAEVTVAPSELAN